MDTYITKMGDTFDIIAHNILGNRVYTKDLIEANLDSIDIIIFSGNVTLNIPVINVAAIINQPPWRA